MRRYLMAAFATVITIGAATQSTARADLVLHLGTPINGTTPVGSTPWATLDFHTVSTGDVRLTITNGMTASSSEFLALVLFNVSGATLSASSFTHVSGATYSDVSFNNDGAADIKAGVFGVSFDYPTNHADQFLAGQSVYEIKAAGITEQSFDATSTLGYYAAAKVQGIPTSKSGSIGTMTASVPEPSTLLLGTLGVVGIASFRRQLGRRNRA